MPLRNIQSFLANVTMQPGVYQMLDARGEVIYVGKAKNLKKRLSSYFSNTAKDLKTSSLVKQIDNINITVTQSENEAVLLECNLIKKYRPRYNVLLRDDKSFPYIALTTAHPYPRLESYRGARKKDATSFGPFPSGLAVRETLQWLQKVFKIRTCRDTFFASRSRPCLLYQIDRCTAPCVDYVSKDDYALQVNLAIAFLQGKGGEVIDTLTAKMEAASRAQDFESAAAYRDQIARLRQIQDKQVISTAQGHADLIGLAMSAGVCCLQLLTVRNGQVITSRTYFPSLPANASPEEIMASFIKQHYFSEASHREAIPSEIISALNTEEDEALSSVLSEVAGRSVNLHTPQRGEKVKWLNMAQESAKQSLAAHLLSRANMHTRLQALCERLALPQVPKRFYCFDISHSMGEATTASCVVFDKDGPLKAEYRRLNITGVTPGDDVAAMRVAITCRFKRLQEEATSLPELVFIDGGITQLNAAHAALQALDVKHILLVGVSKGPGRKAGFESLHRQGQPAIHLEADDPALHLIQHIRDEAHRFAIAGHRAKRDKRRRTSRLEDVPGIGAKRRRDLLRYFGGIQGVARASLDELIKVPGISRSLAERIFSVFHESTE